MPLTLADILEALTEAQGVRRLSEIEPQRVGIVDKPANKREFLVRKREASMPTDLNNHKSTLAGWLNGLKLMTETVDKLQKSEGAISDEDALKVAGQLLNMLGVSVEPGTIEPPKDASEASEALAKAIGNFAAKVKSDEGKITPEAMETLRGIHRDLGSLLPQGEPAPSPTAAQTAPAAAAPVNTPPASPPPLTPPTDSPSDYANVAKRAITLVQKADKGHVDPGLLREMKALASILTNVVEKVGVAKSDVAASDGLQLANALMQLRDLIDKTEAAGTPSIIEGPLKEIAELKKRLEERDAASQTAVSKLTAEIAKLRDSTPAPATIPEPAASRGEGGDVPFVGNDYAADLN